MISYMYFCPKCRSAAVDRPVLFGGRATCRACGWTGADFELEASAIVSGESDETLFFKMTRDLKGVLSSALTLPFGRFLLRWGFLGKDELQSQFPKYMEALAKAVVYSVIHTREAIELDQVQKGQLEKESKSAVS